MCVSNRAENGQNIQANNGDQASARSIHTKDLLYVAVYIPVAMDSLEMDSMESLSLKELRNFIALKTMCNFVP